MIVETIHTTMEKITLRRKEVFQLPPELGFWKIVQKTDPDPDPCEPICAMIARSGTNLEGGSRVP